MQLSKEIQIILLIYFSILLKIYSTLAYLIKFTNYDSYFYLRITLTFAEEDK